MALRLSSLRPGRPDKPKMPPSGNMYPTVQANRDMKKTSLLGACILALAMSMGSGEAVAKTPPDQLIIGMNMNNLLTLDPAAMTGNEVVGIVVNLYDSLVELDPEQLTTVRPALAKSWDISPDGKTLTFHLRDDVKFHSGNPLTAADVVWSMRRILHLNLAQASVWKSYGFSKKNIDSQVSAPEKQLHSYGYKGLTNEALNVTLVEAGERILPALPPRISGAAHNELTKLGVRVLTQTMVTSADAGGLHTKDGEYIEADLMVWAAGIKAPDFMKEIGGLETNRINQLVVEPTLQTTRDADIFAIGDCASCARPEGGFVPPRAQAAHQMATCALNNILAQMKGKPLKAYTYKDHGSLVSLSNYSTVGSLMGNLMRGSMMVEGRIARFVYISLYRMHQIALHGYFKTGLMMLVGRINRIIRPRLKLH